VRLPYLIDTKDVITSKKNYVKLWPRSLLILCHYNYFKYQVAYTNKFQQTSSEKSCYSNPSLNMDIRTALLSGTAHRKKLVARNERCVTRGVGKSKYIQITQELNTIVIFIVGRSAWREWVRGQWGGMNESDENLGC
jgi:hypothetical protein